ncbi:MAG TPA: hypothetical protein VMA32_03605 [Streptosporangiaceae bacterium]|nr:hypothetical protein [Streptosporangiaceae bacterium]
MYRTSRIAAASATLAISAFLVLSTALPAFAARVPAPGEFGPQGPGGAAVQVVTQGGLPGWQVALIAVGAALAAAALTALADRAGPGRRRFAAG